MAITSSAGDGIRITTAAKSGTVKSFTSGKVRLEDPITVGNNGNLEASPTYTDRLIYIDGGTGIGQIRFITGETLAQGDGNDVDLDVHEPWAINPDATSTFQIPYVQGDVATVTGATLSSKTGVLELSRELSIGSSGGGGAFAFLFFTNYQGVEGTDDTSSTQPSFIVEDNGFWQCGYLSGGVPVSGAIITAFRNTDGEDFIQFNAGSLIALYATILRSWLADLLWQQTSDANNVVIVQGCTIIDIGDNVEWEQGIYIDIQFQAKSRTADTILIHGNTIVDGIILTQTNGFIGRDNGVTEEFTVRNVTFSQNIRHVRVNDDKIWNFVNSKGWIPTSTFISFEVDDLNEVRKKFSLDIILQDESGTAVDGAVTAVYETIQNNLPPENKQSTDASGEATSDVLEQLYTFPSSVFTTTTFSGFALRVYKYGKNPVLISFIATTDGHTFPTTLVEDSAITESSQIQAVEDGIGITITRHETGETDPRPINLIRFTGGTDGGDGPPSVGDTITGGSSGATGEVVELLGSATANGFLIMENRNATAFSDGETLTDTTQTNQWTATSDTTPAPGVDLDFTWLVDANSEALTAVYDYLAAKMATQRNPFCLEDDGGTFTDFTNEIKDPNITSTRLLPATPAVNDAIYFSDIETGFEKLVFDLTTGVSGVTIVWEYWNGAWTAFTGLSDGTSGLTTDGTLTFTFPSDWVKTTAYAMRARVSAVTTPVGGSVALVEIDPVFEKAVIWGGDQETQLLYLGTSGFFTRRHTVNTEGVIVVNRGSGTIEFFTSDGGTTWVPPATVDLKVTISNQQGDLLQGINVRYEESDGTLIATGSTNASGVFNFQIEVSELPLTNAKIIARRKDFEDFETTLDIPSGGFDIPISLQPDLDVDLP
jgi:hypothetical protein